MKDFKSFISKFIHQVYLYKYVDVFILLEEFDNNGYLSDDTINRLLNYKSIDSYPDGLIGELYQFNYKRYLREERLKKLLTEP